MFAPEEFGAEAGFVFALDEFGADVGFVFALDEFGAEVGFVFALDEFGAVAFGRVPHRVMFKYPVVESRYSPGIA